MNAYIKIIYAASAGGTLHIWRQRQVMGGKEFAKLPPICFALKECPLIIYRISVFSSNIGQSPVKTLKLNSFFWFFFLFLSLPLNMWTFSV